MQGNTLIIGGGEIGRALYEVFSPYYPTLIRDKEDVETDREIDVMHIAFPYTKHFPKYVKDYIKKYKPKYTVVHSTVPPGTCRKLGVIHSPVKGVHPYLAESIKTFHKFLGGRSADKVADYFRRANLRVYVFDKADTTELIKIDSTNWYGVCIEKTKDTKKLCDKYNVPFEAFYLWTQDYNDGYEKLGHPEYKRPLLTPIMTKIKGHCVLPNAKLLDSKFTDLINNLNEDR